MLVILHVPIYIYIYIYIYLLFIYFFIYNQHASRRDLRLSFRSTQRRMDRSTGQRIMGSFLRFPKPASDETLNPKTLKPSNPKTLKP